MMSAQGSVSREAPRKLIRDTVKLALSLVRPDGTVVLHDERGETVEGPIEAIDPYALPDAFKRRDLHHIATAINTAIAYTAGRDPTPECERLAQWLAPYREHPDFVWHGAALIIVNESGYPIRIEAASLAKLDSKPQTE